MRTIGELFFEFRRTFCPNSMNCRQFWILFSELRITRFLFLPFHVMCSKRNESQFYLLFRLRNCTTNQTGMELMHQIFQRQMQLIRKPKQLDLCQRNKQIYSVFHMELHRARPAIVHHCRISFIFAKNIWLSVCVCHSFNTFEYCIQTQTHSVRFNASKVYQITPTKVAYFVCSGRRTHLHRSIYEKTEELSRK